MQLRLDQAWRSDLQALYETLQGRAVLDVDGLLLELAGGPHGHVTVKGRLVTQDPTGTWGSADLRFTMPDIDQTFLPSVVAGLDRALSLPPRVPDWWDE